MSIKKKILIALPIGALAAAGVVFYMFNQPARNVQDTKTDFSYESSAIVNEYLTDAATANNKYLDENGDSKVLEITGTVASISENFKHQKVILLKNKADKAGVSATFTEATNANANTVAIGNKVTIKGVIRSGASFDEDLEMYENVVLDKCDIVTK